MLNHISVIQRLHNPDRRKGNLLLILSQYLPVCLNLEMETALHAFMYLLVQANFSALATLNKIPGR